MKLIKLVFFLYFDLKRKIWEEIIGPLYTVITPISKNTLFNIYKISRKKVGYKIDRFDQILMVLALISQKKKK